MNIFTLKRWQALERLPSSQIGFRSSYMPEIHAKQRSFFSHNKRVENFAVSSTAFLKNI